MEIMLNAAASLLMQEGFAATMDAIASAAGVSKRTLYAKFPDKLALFEAVLVWLKRDAAQRSMVLPADVPIDATLRTYAMMLYDLYAHTELGRFHRLMQKEYERFPELERIARAEFHERHIQPLCTYLAQRPEGECRIADCGIVAKTLSQTVMAEITGRLVGHALLTREEFENYTGTLVDLLMHGIAGPA